MPSTYSHEARPGPLPAPIPALEARSRADEIIQWFLGMSDGHRPGALLALASCCPELAAALLAATAGSLPDASVVALVRHSRIMGHFALSRLLIDPERQELIAGVRATHTGG